MNLHVGRVFVVYSQGDIAAASAYSLSVASIIVIPVTRTVFSAGLPRSVSGAGNSTLCAVNITLQSSASGSAWHRKDFSGVWTAM
jgi:hypothetical protein